MKSIKMHENWILASFTFLQLLGGIIAIQVMGRYNLGVGNDMLSLMINLLFYSVIFIIPILLYLKFYNKTDALEFLKLNRNKVRSIYKAIIIGSFIFVFLFLKNRFHISSKLNFSEDIFLILGTTLVGFFEEIPFRGFYLQKFRQYMGFWRANILSASFFTIMHIPGKYYMGLGNINSILVILLIGLWMGYIFRETESLWSVAIIHSIYNLSLYLVY
jgi:uncharacterized protein